MIGYLKGELLRAQPSSAIINCGGVGYLVSISLRTFEKINSKSIVELFVYTAVREDAINLFGFAEEGEKIMFELLISVSGVGPKSALGILSSIEAGELMNILERGDVTRLTTLPGVGKKTAERLILELRGKVAGIPGMSSTGSHSGVGFDAVMALVSLGYQQKIAEKVVKDISEQSPSLKLEEIIRLALKKLSGN